MRDNQNFLKSLFDPTFSHFVGIRVVGVIYALGIFFIGVVCVAIVLSGFSNGFASGLVALLAAPLIFFLYVLLIRIGLEAFVASLRTAENTGKLVEINRKIAANYPDINTDDTIK